MSERPNQIGYLNASGRTEIGFDCSLSTRQRQCTIINTPTCAGTSHSLAPSMFSRVIPDEATAELYI